MSWDAGKQSTARRLLREEIERIVAEADAAGETIRAGEFADQLFAAYPDANFSLGRIVDELISAAAARKVPIEISRH